MMEFIKKMKDLFNENKSRKKNIQNLVIILIGIVIIISVGGYLFKDDGKEEQTITANVDDIFNPNDFEKKLSNILSNIVGAGDVSVMVSYQTGTETVPLIDTKDNSTVTEEVSSTGNRKTQQNQAEANIIFNQEENGDKVPYISKRIMPTVEGVIVTCEGGGDVMVKADIIRAVQAVTGISANKVQVFPKQVKKNR